MGQVKPFLARLSSELYFQFLVLEGFKWHCENSAQMLLMSIYNRCWRNKLLFLLVYALSSWSSYSLLLSRPIPRISDRNYHFSLKALVCFFYFHWCCHCSSGESVCYMALVAQKNIHSNNNCVYLSCVNRALYSLIHGIWTKLGTTESFTLHTKHFWGKSK